MADRKQDQELLKQVEIDRDTAKESRTELERTRTRIGAKQEEATPEFFLVIEWFINVHKMLIDRDHRFEKQVNSCIDYVNKFEARDQELQNAINELGKKVEKIYRPIHDKHIVERFFDSKFAKISKYLGWAAMVVTLLTYWSGLAGFISIGG